MNRRIKSIKQDPLYFVLLVVLCIIFHFNLVVSDQLEISLYPLAFLGVAFIGYKYGKINAVIAVLSSFLILLIIKYRYNELFIESYGEEFSLLFTDKIEFELIVMMGQSVWDYLLMIAFGVLVTIVFDWLEKTLAQVNITLDELLPYQRYFYLAKIVQFWRYILVTKTSSVSSETQVNIDLPYGIKINLNILYKRVLLTLSIPIIFLLSLQYNLIITEWLDFSLFPYYTAIPLILIFCWFKGVIKTLWLIITMFIFSIILMAVMEGQYLTDTLSVYPIFQDVSIVVLTIIMAWWLDKLNMAWHDPRLKRKLLKLDFFRGFKHRLIQTCHFPAGAALIMMLCALPIEIERPAFAFFDSSPAAADSTEELLGDNAVGIEEVVVVGETIDKRIYYNPLLILLVVVLIYCGQYNPYSISNTLFVALSIQTCIYWDPMQLFEQPYPINILFYYGGMIEIILICLIPVIYRFLTLTTLKQIRTLLLTFSLAIMMFSTITSQLQHSFIVSFGDTYLEIILGLLIHLALVELLARYLHRKKLTSDAKVAI